MVGFRGKVGAKVGSENSSIKPFDGFFGKSFPSCVGHAPPNDWGLEGTPALHLLRSVVPISVCHERRKGTCPIE